jgi:hypothetical protein
MRITGTGHEQPFELTSICSECASFVKVISSIEDPAVINQILTHLAKKRLLLVCRNAGPRR